MSDEPKTDPKAGSGWIFGGGAGAVALVIALLVWLFWGGEDATVSVGRNDAPAEQAEVAQTESPPVESPEAPATAQETPVAEPEQTTEIPAETAEPESVETPQSTEVVESEMPDAPEDVVAGNVAETAEPPESTKEEAPRVSVVKREDAPESTTEDTPSFDIVRVDPEGGALVAGKAAANATISVQVDGEEVGSVETDSSGSFAALFDMPTSSEAQVIELVARDPEGVEARSADTVIVAPKQAAVADASGTTAGEAAEPAAPAVLLAREDGIEMLQPAGALAASSVVLDVISYGGDGAVVLEGRAVEGGGQVQVYLNNALTGRGAIDGSHGWQLRLPSVTPGVYTLRVDQVDGSGKVLSRFETPFKREDPDVLAALLPTGTDGAVSASVITVQAGYTLWGIASDRYGSGNDYVQIFEANKTQIADPDLIYPGQVFELPEDGQPVPATE